MLRYTLERSRILTSFPYRGMFSTQFDVKLDKKFDIEVNDFINFIRNSKKSANTILPQFGKFLLRNNGKLTQWKILELTKDRIIEWINDPSLDIKLGQVFVLNVMHYLLRLRNGNIIWHTESLQSELFEELDNYIIKNASKVRTFYIGSLLKVMSSMNYQNKRLLDELAPRVLKADDVTLKDTLNTVKALYKTNLIMEPELRSLYTKHLNTYRAFLAFKNLNPVETEHALYTLIGCRSYPEHYILDFLSGAKINRKYNKKVYVLCCFLYEIDRDFHNILLGPFEELRDGHIKLYNELLPELETKLTASRWENDLAEQLKLELKNAKDVEILFRKIIDYWSVDIIVKLKGKKPILIDVGWFKEFRNDIYVNSNVHKERWLNYKGYNTCEYNEIIHNNVMKKNKNAVKGLIKYLHEAGVVQPLPNKN